MGSLASARCLRAYTQFYPDRSVITQYHITELTCGWQQVVIGGVPLLDYERCRLYHCVTTIVQAVRSLILLQLHDTHVSAS